MGTVYHISIYLYNYIIRFYIFVLLTFNMPENQ